MRTLIIVNLLGFGLMAMGVQSSHGSIVSANWDITNDTDEDAQDFEVFISRPGNLPTDSVNGAFGKLTPTILPPPPVPPFVELKWDGGTVMKGKSTHVGVEFDSPVNSAVPFLSYWTDANGKQIGGQTGLPGFEAHSLAGDPVTAFSVIDGTDEPLVFHNLQFQTRLNDTPLDQLIPYTLPGFGASVPDFTLAAGQSMEFDIETGADDFVLAQMITYFPSNPAATVGTVVQHQISTPETTTWTMMLLGFVSLGYAGFRRARNEVRR